MLASATASLDDEVWEFQVSVGQPTNVRGWALVMRPVVSGASPLSALTLSAVWDFGPCFRASKVASPAGTVHFDQGAFPRPFPQLSQ
jgi:hypothetical protein